MLLKHCHALEECRQNTHHRPLAGTNLYCLVTEVHGCEQTCLRLLPDSAAAGNRTHDRRLANPTTKLPTHPTMGWFGYHWSRLNRAKAALMRSNDHYWPALYSWCPAMTWWFFGGLAPPLWTRFRNWPEWYFLMVLRLWYDREPLDQSSFHAI